MSAIIGRSQLWDPVYGTLYIATDGSASSVPAHGVYRSTDGGSTWTAVNTNIPLGDQYITSFALDPLPLTGIPITLYAGTSTGKVYRTQNGTAWASPVGTSPLPGNAVTALAIEMADPEAPTALSGGESTSAATMASTDCPQHRPGVARRGRTGYDGRGARTPLRGHARAGHARLRHRPRPSLRPFPRGTGSSLPCDSSSSFPVRGTIFGVGTGGVSQVTAVPPIGAGMPERRPP